MDLTIDEAIQHIKNSCYIIGYPTHDKQDETRKRINTSLDMAIETMRKYQKIQEIIKNWKDGRFSDLLGCLRIKAVLDGNDEALNR